MKTRAQLGGIALLAAAAVWAPAADSAGVPHPGPPCVLHCTRPSLQTFPPPRESVDTTLTTGVQGVVGDRATLTDCFWKQIAMNLSIGCSGGTVTFTLVGPNNCAAVALGPFFSQPVKVDQLTGTEYAEIVFPWTPQKAGDYYWLASYSGNVFNLPVGPVGCGDPAEKVHVLAQSSLLVGATVPPGGVVVGASTSIAASGSLRDFAPLAPDDTITFTLVGPDSCDRVALGPFVAPVHPDTGTASTGPVDFAPTAAGDYYWTATFSGDANNTAIDAPTGCGDPGALVHVGPSLIAP